MSQARPVFWMTEGRGASTACSCRSGCASEAPAGRPPPPSEPPASARVWLVVAFTSSFVSFCTCRIALVPISYA